jgi:ATP-binding cassette, subfamily C (CFTR/MRP), member 1
MNCHVEADNVFGPQVDGACRNGFDFTLFFEQTLLSIVPSAVTIIASSIFFVHLLRKDTKIRIDARRSFRAAKQVCFSPVLADKLCH